MSVNKRKCKKCSASFPPTSFPSAGIKKGKKYYRHICKKCYQHGKTHYREVNRVWSAQYKSKLKCVKCGYSKETHPSFSVRALQFHHPNDDKLAEVSNLIHRGFSQKTIMKEINKCIVLCARCHAELHD